MTDPFPVRRCAFLTLEDPTGYVIDDELAYPALAALGWSVEAVPWSRPQVDWSAYDAVVIRSTWDYAARPEAFLESLGEIERSGAPLFNSLDLVRWNIRKTYLREMAGRGVAVVPTLWRERLAPGELAALVAEVGTAEVVIKPVVGLNAEGAYWLNESTARARADEVEACYAERSLMAQPFLRAIRSEGEFSLFYFHGEYSHTISKTPLPDDFRVQEEHGGIIRAVAPGAALREAGEAARRAIGSAPLYLRADFVRANEGDGYWLMELELIEPALYFRMDPGAPGRFARALQKCVAGAGS